MQLVADLLGLIPKKNPQFNQRLNAKVFFVGFVGSVHIFWLFLFVVLMFNEALLLESMTPISNIQRYQQKIMLLVVSYNYTVIIPSMLHVERQFF